MLVFMIAIVISISGGCNSTLRLDNEYDVDTSQTKNKIIGPGNDTYNNYESLNELTIIYSMYNSDLYYQNTHEWAKYISDKYGITLSVNYNISLDKEITDIDNYVIYTAPVKFYGNGTNTLILNGIVPHTDSMKSENPYDFEKYL